MSLEGERKLSGFFLFALLLLLLLAAAAAFLNQGCAIGSQYTRTDSTVTVVGPPDPVGFGLRDL